MRVAFPAALALVVLPLTVGLFEAGRYDQRNSPTHTIMSSGVQRDYMLHVPASYDSTRPAPLVLTMHGAGLWGAGHLALSRWDRLADEKGFIVVSPTGTDTGPNIWMGSDVLFLADLIDTVAARFNIDRSRVYVNGLSNGGGMSFEMSCAMRDRVAAVGMVGPALLLPWRGCRDLRPMPVIAFHGDDDRMTPYTGGISPVAPIPFPNIPAFMSRWAQRNGCGATPRDTAIAPDVVRRTWDCPAGAPVELRTILGGGHTWPGGEPLPAWLLGATSSHDATRAMWEFFERARDSRPR